MTTTSLYAIKDRLYTIEEVLQLKDFVLSILSKDQTVNWRSINTFTLMSDQHQVLSFTCTHIEYTNGDCQEYFDLPDLMVNLVRWLDSLDITLNDRYIDREPLARAAVRTSLLKLFKLHKKRQLTILVALTCMSCLATFLSAFFSSNLYLFFLAFVPLGLYHLICLILFKQFVQETVTSN